jgi:hypothetical protein
MGPDEARRVDAALRRLGVAGVVAPVDPENPAGEWRVYDTVDTESRRDITADALAAVAAHVTPPEPSGPTRGFVIPPKGDSDHS